MFAFCRFAADQRGSNDKNRLEFWFRSEEVGRLSSFLSPYMSGETQLPASDFKNVKKEISNPDALLSRAEEIDDAVSQMKDAMRSDLNECFREFKMDLENKSKGS